MVAFTPEAFGHLKSLSLKGEQICLRIRPAGVV
jgi:hypothetical protein